MKNWYISILLWSTVQTVLAQNFYYQPFTGASWPSGWTSSDTRIVVSGASSSSGYSSSPTSPPASGGNNVRLDDCLPLGNSVSLTASGVISTLGKTNIRVGFGRRASNAFTNTVAFEYSADGASWNLIDGDVAAGASPTWSTLYYDLPSDADNVSNLRFRFSYITGYNQNCTAPPNFRLDDFIVGENFSLPVELTDLSARLEGKTVRLRWSTASETDNAYFAVERSADGRDFAEIGRVNGAGTVREIRTYTYTDVRPLRGANYYRLRQTDFDGESAFSPVRVVDAGGTGGIRLFPSPAGAILTLQWQEALESESTWTIFDAMGRAMATGVCPAGNTEAEIPVAQLPQGLYVLRTTSGRESGASTFLKQ